MVLVIVLLCLVNLAELQGVSIENFVLIAAYEGRSKVERVKMANGTYVKQINYE